MQLFDFRVNFFKLTFFLPEVSLLLFYSFLKNSQLSSQRFSLSVDNVVLIHALDPHLKILGSERRTRHLIVVELRLVNNSGFESLDGFVRDVILVIDLDQFDKTHQVFHQKFTAHLEVVFFFFSCLTWLWFLIDNLSSVSHNPVPEEDDQTCAYSDDGRGGIIEAFNFIQMVFFELFDFQKSLVELLLSIRTLFLCLFSQGFSLVGLNGGFLFFFSHNSLLCLGVLLIPFDVNHELSDFFVFLFQLRLHIFELYLHLFDFFVS